MKKGFTLIEVIISTALIGTIAVYEVMIFGRYVIIDKKNAEQQKMELYVDEAFNFIGNEIEDSRYIECKENSIILQNGDKEAGNHIELDTGNNLIIKYGNLSGDYSNVIAGNIKNFSAIVNGKLIYVDITDVAGKKYEKCYGISH